MIVTLELMIKYALFTLIMSLYSSSFKSSGRNEKIVIS